MESTRKSRTDERLDDLARRMDHGFESVGRRFEQIDVRFGRVEHRLDKIDDRFERLEHSLVQIAWRMSIALLGLLAALLGLAATQL